jgi:Spy/CpxP family protein refolding chaperone
MKRTLVYTIMGMALGGLLLLPAVPANAQEKGFHMGPPGDAQMEKQMAEGEKAAGISQEQREKMKALREEFRSKQKTLMDQVKAKREALRQELDSVSPNRAKAETLAKEINTLQGQTALNRIDEVFKVRTIMTPEQYQKLREFHEKNREKFQDKMKEKMGDRKEHGMGAHGGDVWGGGRKDVK